MVYNYDSLTVGKQIITVKYGDQKYNFTVNVNEKQPKDDFTYLVDEEVRRYFNYLVSMQGILGSPCYAHNTLSLASILAEFNINEKDYILDRELMIKDVIENAVVIMVLEILFLMKITVLK